MMATRPSGEEAIAVFAEQMAFANVHARPSMVLTGPAALVTCAVAVQEVAATRLGVWIGTLLFAYGVRFAGVVAYARRVDRISHGERRVWSAITAALAALSGLAWGILPVWAVASSSTLAMVANVVIIAVSAVSMRGLAPLWATYASFVVGLLGPVTTISFLAGTLAGKAMGAATVVYALAVLLVSRQAGEDFVKRTLLEMRMRALLISLEKARAAAEVANAAKSRFIANVSHEVRTPLQGVLGLTDLLLASSLDDTQRTRALTIARSGRSLLRILNDVLDFSKLEAGKLVLESTNVDLRAVVRETVSLHAAAAETKGVALRASVGATVPRNVVGDPVRIAEILGNLVSNALKFTERGSVTATVSRGASDAIRLSVKDTGIGLSDEEQSRVFAPFTQSDASTTRRYGGTGLGLSIVQHLVELFGGQLGVVSAKGAGAEFWCELPLRAVEGDDGAGEALELLLATDVSMAPPSPRADAAPAAVPIREESETESRRADQGRGSDVLVAEDNDVNRMVVVAVLQSLGLPYRVAHDGQEALEAFMDRPPALILMDSQMPRLSGGDCTRSIRAIEAERELQRTPIIALTANASAADREACMVAGMDDFLAKPFALTDLRAHVLRWVRPTGADHGRAVAAPATPGE